jgi:hypothetical protein
MSTISAISKYWDTLTYHFGIFWEEPDSDLDSHSILDKSIPWRCLLDALTSMLGNGSTSNQEMVRLRSQHSHIDAYSCFLNLHEEVSPCIPHFQTLCDLSWSCGSCGATAGSPVPAVLYCDAGHMLLGRRGSDGDLYTLLRGCAASPHSHVNWNRNKTSRNVPISSTLSQC